MSIHDEPLDLVKSLQNAWHFLSECQSELKHIGCLTPDVRGQLETLKMTVASMEEDARAAGGYGPFYDSEE